MDELRKIKIKELNLSKYTYNALRRAGISTLYDIKSLINEDNITHIRYVGEEAEKEIIEKFTEYINDAEGIHLKNSTKRSDSIKGDNLNPIDIGNDLSVQILEEYLGEQTIKNLLKAKIYTLDDLNDLVSAYLRIINSEESILDHTNEELAKTAKSLILEKGLHLHALLEGKTLYNIIYQVPESVEEKLSKYKHLKRILHSKSLREELDSIFQDIPIRNKEIFVKYTLERTPYRELGNQYGLSGERTRQIYNNSVEIICRQLEANPNLYLQSVCLIADELGKQLNPETLNYRLKETGMLDSKLEFQNQSILNVCLALMINRQTSILIDPILKSRS